jgi:Family of unknown function (DUF5759)
MITVHKINQIEDRRRKIKKEIYTKIYEQFCRKIQIAVAANQKYVILQVPSFLLGYPSYDVDKAAVYLKRQLILGGFSVRDIDYVQFCVAWHVRKLEPIQETSSEEVCLPSLINLKKAANKYR